MMPSVLLGSSISAGVPLRRSDAQDHVLHFAMRRAAPGQLGRSVLQLLRLLRHGDSRDQRGHSGLQRLHLGGQLRHGALRHVAAAIVPIFWMAGSTSLVTQRLKGLASGLLGCFARLYKPDSFM